MRPDIGHQPGVLFGRFGMAASKANGYTRSFRQRKGFAQKTVFRLQRQENAVVTIITPGVEVFGGDTHPDLAKEQRRFRLPGLQFASDANPSRLPLRKLCGIVPDLAPLNLRFASLNGRKIRSSCRLFLFSDTPWELFAFIINITTVVMSSGGRRLCSRAQYAKISETIRAG